MASEPDIYELLGVSRDADAAAIKAAYRKMAMQYHPDRNPGDAEAEARFKAIGAAYEVLKDPQKRAAYDQYGHAAFQQGGGGGRGGHQADFGDIGDIFETIFGSAFGGMRQGARRGADLRYDLEITLEEAFHGKSTTIEIEVSQQCEVCTGTGAEPGTGTRACNMCAGYGKVRAQQGLFVVERPCPNCHGRGEVIETPCRNCRGDGRVDAPQSLSVDIPPGVDTGTRIRLSGKGEAGPRGAPPGDLYIFIHIRAHSVFARDGSNLIARVPISFTTAALGGKVEIPDLDGSTNTINLDDLGASFFTQALENIATLRADNGGTTSRLNFALEHANRSQANLEAANGRIVDVDIAAESTRLAKYNILVQASASMLSQANVAPNAALMLLS